jgi:hypothetical protein
MSPIIYKMIPTQYAFYVSEDGTLQIQAVTKIPTVKKFNSPVEAREFINNYIQQL